MSSLLLFLQRCSGVLLRCCCGPPRGTAPQCRSGPPCGTALEAQKQKIGSQCNFFAITDCLEIPNCESSRKNQGNWLYCGPILLFGNGKSSAIAKKLQKCRDFCFCSGLTPTFGTLLADRRNEADSARGTLPREEHGVLPFTAAARHYRCC